MSDGDMGRTLQQAVAITTLSPVLDGHLHALNKKLLSVRTIPLVGRPLQALAFIHFGRWTPITELPAPGGPVVLKSAYLLFESTFDGSWADYLDAFSDRLPARLAALWGECEEFTDKVEHAPGYTGSRMFPAGAFKRYVARNQLRVLHFYGVYPEATTRMVRQAIALAGPPAVAARERPQVVLGPVPPRRPAPVEVRDELRAWWRAVRRDHDPGPLTLALPIDPEQCADLVERLEALPEGGSPLAHVRGTHFARFVLMPRKLGLPDRPPRDELPCPYLLFTSNHDGDRAAYVAELARAEQARWIWAACQGCPDSQDELADWLGRHAIDTSYFVMGYPPRSVQAIRGALGSRSEEARQLASAVAPAPPDRIRVSDVQGNVLRAYGIRFPCAAYVLLALVPGRRDDALGLIADWSRRVAFGGPAPCEETDGSGERARLNLGFTHAGLAALGADRWTGEFPAEFRAGAAARSPMLGDRGESAVAKWEYGRRPGHVLATVHASSERFRDRAVERLQSELHSAGDPLAVLHTQLAALLPRAADDPSGGQSVPSCGDVYSREHFGFADGCSQPAIVGMHEDVHGSGVFETLPSRTRAAGILQAWGWAEPRTGWRGVAPGEFVLGYPNEDDDLPPGSSSPLGPDGTFMVYRKLEQHVQRFRAHTERCASELGVDVDEVRARIVGRWTDGTPLVLSQRPDPAISLDRGRANAFSYHEDPDGARCPLGAHVRRTNPRAGQPAGGEATMRHRIIRRGLPYGQPLEADPDGSRGLVFVCYSASIGNGFETIQQQWCDRGFQLGLGEEPDYLLQQPDEQGRLTGQMAISYDPPRVLAPPAAPFVTVRGTEYLFMPGRSGLVALAGLAERRDD